MIILKLSSTLNLFKHEKLTYSRYIFLIFLFLTELSKPRVISMRKNISDQNVENGRVAMASGYTTNTRPGPGKQLYTGIK